VSLIGVGNAELITSKLASKIVNAEKFMNKSRRILNVSSVVVSQWRFQTHDLNAEFNNDTI
jgi:hypothetical protein